MNAFLTPLRPALVSTALLAVVCCGLYPAAVTGLAAWLFPRQAAGSLVRDEKGIVRGSLLLGQNFTEQKYFHPRPSAAGTNGYDATASGGGNLGPTSRKLADQIAVRVAAYRRENNLPDAQPVPADAVTASASGLDPHISPANAALQAARVAKARDLPVTEIRTLISQNTDTAGWGVFGEEGVNVLKLNLALDSLGSHQP